MADGRLEITDELLVAYVDDELDADQHALVTATLERDPALSRRAEEMRLVRDLLREAFPLQSAEPLPAHIHAALERLAAAAAQQAPPARLASHSRYRWDYGIAAALVLCAAISAMWFAMRVSSAPAQPEITQLTDIPPESPLYRVLESTPGAQLVEVTGENATARAVLTFRARDGRFCREFEVLASSGGSTGIACREQDAWRIEVLLSAAAAPPDSNYYTPAAGSGARAIAAVVDELIQGEPLSAQEEARALAKAWQTGAPRVP